MKINKLHIVSFCGIKNKTIELCSGINMICGDNESGKSTIGDFICFMLYGFSSRTESEHSKSLSDDVPEGVLNLSIGDNEYRIERKLKKFTVFNSSDNSTVDMDTEPGEYFTGIDKYVFRTTAYVSQSGGGYIDGKKLSEAVENIMFSANADVNTVKALEKLDAYRAKLSHKNGHGGIISELTEQKEQLGEQLEKNTDTFERISELEEKLSTVDENLQKAEKNADIAKSKSDYYAAAVELLHLNNVEQLGEKVNELEKELADIRADATYDGFVPNKEYFSKLQELSDEQNDITSRIEECRKEYNSVILDNSYSDTGKRIGNIESFGSVNKAEKLYYSSCRKQKASIAFIILLSLIASVTVYFLLKNNEYIKQIYLAVAVVASFSGIATSVAVLISSKLNLDKLQNITGAPDTDSIITVLEMYNEDSAVYNRQTENLSNLSEKISSDEERLEDINSEICRLLDFWGEQSIDSAIERYLRFQSQTDDIEREIARTNVFINSVIPGNIHAKKEELCTTLKNNEDVIIKFCEEGTPLLYQDCSDIDALSSESDKAKKLYNFSYSAACSLSDKKHGIEIELASLKGCMMPVAEISEKYYTVSDATEKAQR